MTRVKMLLECAHNLMKAGYASPKEYRELIYDMASSPEVARAALSRVDKVIAKLPDHVTDIVQILDRAVKYAP